LKLSGPEGGGALTMPGVQQLLRFLDANATIEGRAQSAMEQNFLRQAHAAITGTQDVADPAADARFQSFLGAYFPALDAGLRSRKSAIQLLSAAGSDYLGTLIPAFTPPEQARPSLWDRAAAHAGESFDRTFAGETVDRIQSGDAEQLQADLIRRVIEEAQSKGLDTTLGYPIGDPRQPYAGWPIEALEPMADKLEAAAAAKRPVFEGSSAQGCVCGHAAR
jgi:hypothetical protein